MPGYESYVKGPIQVVSDARSAAVDVDVAVCVTQSKSEFFRNDWLSRGCCCSPWVLPGVRRRMH